MQSVGTLLDRHKGFGPGFDFLRLWLAVSVLWFHSFVIVGTMHDIEATPAWYFIYMIMPMFFALSGFLVAASALRLSLSNFLINRFCRIIPALWVQTWVAAFIIGPAFTVMALHDYFTDPLFTRWFANMAIWIQYQLPGVFTTHPSNAVNQSIWSIPFEVTCYAMVCASTLFRGSQKHPFAIFTIVAVLLIGPVAYQLTGMVGENGKTGHKIIDYALFTRGSLLFPSFLLGTFAYWVRYYIPYSRKLAAACVLACLALAVFGVESWRSFYLLNLVSVPMLVYLTVFIGCCPMPRIPFYWRGDYSYGIYLYGYPLQQVLFALFPVALASWLPHFIASLLFTTFAAVLSWHGLEKHILRMRKKYSMAAQHMQA